MDSLKIQGISPTPGCMLCTKSGMPSSAHLTGCSRPFRLSAFFPLRLASPRGTTTKDEEARVLCKALSGTVLQATLHSNRQFCTPQGRDRRARRKVCCQSAAQAIGSLEEGLKNLDACLVRTLPVNRPWKIYQRALLRISSTVIPCHFMQQKDDPAGDTAALDLVKELKAEGLIRAFGNGHQVHIYIMLSVDLMMIIWPRRVW